MTSGGFGHRVGHSIALGYVDRAYAEARDFAVELIGELRPATRLVEPAYDPKGEKMRI